MNRVKIDKEKVEINGTEIRGIKRVEIDYKSRVCTVSFAVEKVETVK